MTGFLVSHAGDIAYVTSRIFSFFMLWALLSLGLTMERRFADHAEAITCVPPHSTLLTWIVCGSFAVACVRLIAFGTDGIAVTYLIASPGFLVGIVLFWRIGDAVYNVLPLDLRAKRRLKLRKFLEAGLLLAFGLWLQSLEF